MDFMMMCLMLYRINALYIEDMFTPKGKDE